MCQDDTATCPADPGRNARELAHRQVEHTTDLVWFAGADDVVLHANPAARDVLGCLVEHGQNAFAPFTVASRAVVETEVKPRLAGGQNWEGELSVSSPHGTIPLSVVITTVPYGIALAGRDLRARERIDAMTRHDALHDRLTGLRNRNGLVSAAEVVLAQGRAAVLVVHVEDLAVVSLVSGPQTVDTTMRELAKRLRRCLRDDDVAARLDDNDLAVLLPGDTADDATAVGHRVLDALAADHFWLERTRPLTIHVAVVAGPARTRLPDLLRRAEIALNDGRRTMPGGGVTTYDTDVHDALAEVAQLRFDLADAVEAGHLDLVYQPLVSLTDTTMYGVEALARWNHPARGPISPDVFVPWLEDDGLIQTAGAWIIDQALRQLAIWDAAAPANNLTVNVNVSGHQLTPELVDLATDALHRHGLEPQRLTLEITESVLANDPLAAINVLDGLRQAGISIAVDDFGTGYSSLASLHRLPADILKIDRSFIRDLDGTGGVLIKLMCQLANTLGMTTVAEGIEESAQAIALRRYGCNHGQGYLWARPLPASEILDQRNHHHTAPARPATV